MVSETASAEGRLILKRGPRKVPVGVKHLATPCHCRGCRWCFPVKTGTGMEISALDRQIRLLVMHYFADNHKGISGEKLAGDFEIYPVTERHHPHRMRKSRQENDLGKRL